jgi:hypothetical protein
MDINIHIKKQQLNLKYLTPLWETYSSWTKIDIAFLYEHATLNPHKPLQTI